MTSPVSFIGLTFDSVDLQLADLSIFFWVARGLDEVPSIRGTDETIPGLAGRVELNRVNDVLPIELRGQVAANPSFTAGVDRRDSFRAGMSQIRTLFASNRARADLIAGLEDGTVRSISARPMNIAVTRQIASEYASLSIELEGYDDWTEVAGS